MALKYPLANGNWSNAANWNDGTLPIAGDDVRANGFTVTIDQDINVMQISTQSSVPAVAGGTFLVNTNRILVCEIYGGSVGSTSCLSGSLGVTVDIIGNVYGGTSTTTYGINLTNSNSVLNITGNVYSGTNNQVNHGINLFGSMNFVGNVFGSNSGFNNVAAINVNSGANLILNGNIIGGGSSNGNVDGIRTIGNCTLNGNIYSGTFSNCVGLRVIGGNCIINSDCYGGSISNTHAVSVLVSTSVVVNGTIFAGLNNSSYGLTSASNNVVVSDVEFTNGIIPINGFVKFKNTAPTITVLKENNTTQQLVDPSTTDTPIEADVRDGVSYASGALTGTLKVPPSTAVSVGVPVDNTTGTAMINISDMGALLSSYVV